MQMHEVDEELILLDTHIWIWLVNGDKKLGSSKALNLIKQRAETHSIRVSIISVWQG